MLGENHNWRTKSPFYFIVSASFFAVSECLTGTPCPRVRNLWCCSAPAVLRSASRDLEHGRAAALQLATREGSASVAALGGSGNPMSESAMTDT